MDRNELRALQQPLKDAYRENPESAVVTLKARSGLGDGVSCSVQTGQALVEAGLHPAAGGTGTQACSGDMLLQALAACAGVTLAAVATSLEIQLDIGGCDCRRRPELQRHPWRRQANAGRLHRHQGSFRPGDRSQRR